MDNYSFVLADSPGLIAGAHEGAGLGHDFLRHIERTRMLLHVVDVSGCEGRDPVEDYDIINRELSQYSAALSALPQLIVANKRGLKRMRAGRFLRFRRRLIRAFCLCCVKRRRF